MSKEKLNKSEMAKLCGISVDTLRYYDKLDLFKPSQVEKKRKRDSHK
jgi:DNA-binding transcriptional MerR regulator